METGEICPCNEIGAQPGLSPWLRLSGSVDSLVLQLMARSPHEPRYWTLTISGVLLVNVPHVANRRSGQYCSVTDEVARVFLPVTF
jgi:hypothetical protein